MQFEKPYTLNQEIKVWVRSAEHPVLPQSGFPRQPEVNPAVLPRASKHLETLKLPMLVGFMGLWLDGG